MPPAPLFGTALHCCRQRLVSACLCLVVPAAAAAAPASPAGAAQRRRRRRPAARLLQGTCAGVAKAFVLRSLLPVETHELVEEAQKLLLVYTG